MKRRRELVPPKPTPKRKQSPEPKRVLITEAEIDEAAFGKRKQIKNTRVRDE